jgi:proton-translocating NAD(P)+ transhydrogenase subunit alpha
VAKADVVICTALIPGKRAPVLVTSDMVKAMRAGSVIVDLAAEQQGNCELTKPGQTVVEHGVTLIGVTDMPSRLCSHASQMYSRNMEKLFAYITKDGAWKLDFKDEIVAGSVITHEGQIVHASVKETAQPKAVATTAGAAQ